MNTYSDIFYKKRAQSTRPAMSRGDRAKIFAPFAALRGFEESAHAREKTLIPRPSVAEDRAEQLDRRIRALRRGDTVTLTVFEPERSASQGELGRLRTVTGTLLTIDPVNLNLLLTTGKVPISQVLDVGTR